MIKIPINKYINEYKNLPIDHKNGLEGLIRKRICDVEKECRDREYKEIFRDMLTNSKEIYFENILLATPYELLKIYKYFYMQYNFEEKVTLENGETDRIKFFTNDGVNKKTEIFKLFSKIYDYDSFVNKNNGKWDAYKLCQQLNIKVCPYCNRAFTYTIIQENNEKIIRPQLDHFFPKSKFPMFALSFYNLVPCCSICNSTIKGDKFLDLSEYHHPYICDEEVLFKYRYTIKSGTVPFECDNVSVEIEPCEDIKSNNTYKHFKLDEIYRYHNDVAVDIINKYVIYNSVYVEEIVERINKVHEASIKSEDIKKIIFDECEDNEIVDKILGKMKKDLIAQGSLGK